MRNLIEDSQECVCGKPANRVHCPTCGSLRTAGYATRVIVNRGNGHIAKLKAYRCVRCGEIFNDDDWQLNCHAPISQRGKPKQLTIKVDTVEERAELLERLREIQKLRDLSK